MSPLMDEERTTDLEAWRAEVDRDIRIARLEKRVGDLEYIASQMTDRLEKLSLHARVLHVHEIAAEDNEDRSQFYTMRDLLEKFGCSRQTIYNAMAKYNFPLQAGRLGHGNVQVWSKSAVDEWNDKYNNLHAKRTFTLIRRLKEAKDLRENR